MTSPKHWLDMVLWPVLKLVWEPLSRKNSHFWHWQATSYRPEMCLTIPGDRRAKERHRNILQQLLKTNFGWQHALILRPKNYTGSYQVGFMSVEGGRQVKQLCSVIIDRSCAVLRSPYVADYFAVSYPSGQPVLLEKMNEVPKHQLDKQMLLL